MSQTAPSSLFEGLAIPSMETKIRIPGKENEFEIAFWHPF